MPPTPARPPWPDPFHAPVLGTVFAERTAALRRLHPGDPVILVPDPPDTEDPTVWVHAPGGDVVGHLPYELGGKLCAWMLTGGRCTATVDKLGGDDTPSWKRLVVTVECRA